MRGGGFLGRSIAALAFAKLNLSLSVLSKRPDGLHELSSVMQSVSLADRITLTAAGDGKITAGAGVMGGDDIAVAAAKAFFKALGIQNPGLRIDIEKHIPVAAGLGGGSADCAAVLCCLNEMFRTGLSMRELCSIGFTLGADVPFCLIGSTALVTGAGEVVRPLSPIPDCEFILFLKDKKPGTAQMFAEYDRRFPVEKPAPDMPASDFKWLRGNVQNDFLPLYGDRFDEAFAAVKSRRPVCFGLSGSGPSAFALFENPSGDCAAALRSLGYEVFCAKPERRGVCVLG